VLVPFDEIPAGHRWLSPKERAVEAGLQRETRRTSWRAGRYAAKRLLAGPRDDARAPATDELEDAWAQWTVLAADDGCPVARQSEREPGLVLSLSHRQGWAAAAVGEGGEEVGTDLEVVEPRSERFVRDFFTPREVAAHDRLEPALRPLYCATVWSAKESALKCARTGLRRDTRSVEVEMTPGEDEASAWQPLQVHDRERALLLEGAWRRAGPGVHTLLRAPSRPPGG
jgi:4'-phosphopantetheinyl transferase